MGADGEGLVGVWEAVQPFTLISFGWALGLIGTWVGDRRARVREEIAASERKIQRQFEVGRTNAEELLQAGREAWDVLRAQAITDPTQTADLSAELIDRIRGAGDLVPSGEIRTASEAVCRLLRTPSYFSSLPDIVDFRLPKGPDEAPPMVILQVLAVETLSDMTKAFLREENPTAVINPLLALIIRAAEGLGITVRGLYGP